MSTKNQKNSIEKLVRLIGVASVSALFSFPALAITNSNSNSFDRSVNNRTRSIDSTGISRQLLAQGTSGSGGAGGTGTGGGQTGGGAGGTGAGGGQTGGGADGTGAGGTNSSNGQSNGRQDAFTQSMNAGYTATQQRDYRTALTYFQRALQLRPSNPYARRAVQNVQGYLRRGNNTTQSNQSNR